MTSLLQPITTDRRRLAEDVYQQLLDAIADGHIAPRAQLVQEKLASELGISRTPLREALLRLEQEGVLVRAGRNGFEVRQVTPHDVEKLYGAREAIEGDAARLVAEHGTSADFDAIEAQVIAEEQRQFTSQSEYYHSSRRVHREFVVRSGNPFLVEMFDYLWNRAASFQIYTTTMQMHRLAVSACEHRLLLDAIRASDGDHASRLMRQHIHDGMQMQLDALVPGDGR